MTFSAKAFEGVKLSRVKVYYLLLVATILITPTVADIISYLLIIIIRRLKSKVFGKHITASRN